jgi:hypothetical protein
MEQIIFLPAIFVNDAPLSSINPMYMDHFSVEGQFQYLIM